MSIRSRSSATSRRRAAICSSRTCSRAISSGFSVRETGLTSPPNAGTKVSPQNSCISRLFRPRLARQHPHQRRVALDELLQGALHIGQLVEPVKPVRATAKLPGRLRSAQQQDTEHRDFPPTEVVDLGKPMLVLRHPAVGPTHRAGQALVVQPMKGLPHGILIQVRHRVAVGFLVAGIEQGVHRQRVVVRSGDLFFDQGPEHPRFHFREQGRHCGGSPVGFACWALRAAAAAASRLACRFTW